MQTNDNMVDKFMFVSSWFCMWVNVNVSVLRSQRQLKEMASNEDKMNEDVDDEDVTIESSFHLTWQMIVQTYGAVHWF